MSLAERVLDVLVRTTETEEVRAEPDLDLFASGVLDSLRTVELMVALSDAFGVEISPAAFEREQWATPARIVALMTARVGG